MSPGQSGIFALIRAFIISYRAFTSSSAVDRKVSANGYAYNPSDLRPCIDLTKLGETAKKTMSLYVRANFATAILSAAFETPYAKVAECPNWRTYLGVPCRKKWRISSSCSRLDQWQELEGIDGVRHAHNIRLKLCGPRLIDLPRQDGCRNDIQTQSYHSEGLLPMD